MLADLSLSQIFLRSPDQLADHYRNDKEDSQGSNILRLVHDQSLVGLQKIIVVHQEGQKARNQTGAQPPRVVLRVTGKRYSRAIVVMFNCGLSGYIKNVTAREPITARAYPRMNSQREEANGCI